jgi:hypothetical protein
MNISVKQVLPIGLLLLLPVQKPAKADVPKIPKGIYAVVPIEEVLTKGYPGVQGFGSVPSSPSAAADGFLMTLFESLLSNPAVSGLTLQVYWNTLNPNPGDYTWSYVDDAFQSVQTWNSQNPGIPKTVQLIVTPGFNSPTWLLDQIRSSNGGCAGLFTGSKPGKDCGVVEFTVFQEQKEANGDVLPLPWNILYQQYWASFLQKIAERYNSGPSSVDGADTSFVSIALGGPTAVSDEMLLPSGNCVPSTDRECKKPAYGTFDKVEIPANTMWDDLLTNAGFFDTDQAFVVEWIFAAATYPEYFNGVTLVLTTGSGLPNLSTTGTYTPAKPPEAPFNFAPDCEKVENMDCQAETMVLGFFADPNFGLTNAKATQTSGLEVSREGDDLGIGGVKFLTGKTKDLDTPTSRILGGAQCSTSVANSPGTEGGTTADPTPTPDQALYNVLGDFFSGTPVGGGYFGGEHGTAPLNYLQLYFQDILYATTYVDDYKDIKLSDGSTGHTTFQILLGTASTDLLGMAEKEP